MAPSNTPRSPQSAGPAQRGVGMALLGSSVALLAMAGLAAGGMLPLDASVRGWASAGIGVAAVLDGLIGLYFLRASSQS